MSITRRDLALHVLESCRSINSKGKPPVVQMFLLLTMAERSDGEWTMNELADRVGLPPYQFHRYAMGLVNRGLIDVLRVPNGKCNRYRLNKAGEDTVVAILFPDRSPTPTNTANEHRN